MMGQNKTGEVDERLLNLWEDHFFFLLPSTSFLPWQTHSSKAKVWPDCSQSPSVKPCQGIKLTDLHGVCTRTEREQKLCCKEEERMGKMHKECRGNARLKASD